MATDDFSFPISDHLTSPIDSPPLWHLSPATSPSPSYTQPSLTTNLLDFHTKQLQTNPNNAITPQRNSCSFIDRGGFLRRLKMFGSDHHEAVDQDEEKMDMLWEDLNDEPSINHPNESRMIKLHNYCRGQSYKLMEIGCVPTSFRMVKSSDYDNNKSVSSAVSKNGKKLSAVVLMKVFRKLFLLHHSHQSPVKKSY